MGDEVATSNVNRSYSLGATSIAIFTFMLVFLYPRVASGQINANVRVGKPANDCLVSSQQARARAFESRTR